MKIFLYVWFLTGEKVKNAMNNHRSQFSDIKLSITNNMSFKITSTGSTYKLLLEKDKSVKNSWLCTFRRKADSWEAEKGLNQFFIPRKNFENRKNDKTPFSRSKVSLVTLNSVLTKASKNGLRTSEACLQKSWKYENLENNNKRSQEAFLGR